MTHVAPALEGVDRKAENALGFGQPAGEELDLRRIGLRARRVDLEAELLRERQRGRDQLARDVEIPSHRLEQGSSPHDCHLEPVVALDLPAHLLRALQTGCDRDRSVHRADQDVMETLDLLQTVSRDGCVPSCSLEILDRGSRLAGPHPELPGEADGAREPGLVAELPKHGDGICELAPRR